MPYNTKEKRKNYNDAYRLRKGEDLKKDKRNYWVRQRQEVLLHYSDGELKCKCCGEKEYKFLSIDHINGGGNQHRKSLGSKYIYSWLKQNGYPDGYQVLCHNCNMAKAFYKICPHQEVKLNEDNIQN